MSRKVPVYKDKHRKTKIQDIVHTECCPKLWKGTAYRGTNAKNLDKDKRYAGKLIQYIPNVVSVAGFVCSTVLQRTPTYIVMHNTLTTTKPCEIWKRKN